MGSVESLSSYHKPIIIVMACKREWISRMKVLSWTWKRADWNRYAEEVKRANEYGGQYHFSSIKNVWKKNEEGE